MRSLSKESGGYWVGLFDCCREELKIELMTGMGDDPVIESDSDQNLMLIFGCQPNSGVTAVSTIANEFIERLNQNK